MKFFLDAIESRGGAAYRWELRSSRVSSDLIDVSSSYGRHVIRVRKGLYAAAGENLDVLRALRVGGRLTCVSALSFHSGEPPTPVLHVEVPANCARLRDPDLRGRALGADAAVVIHWARYPGAGDRRAVTAEHAERVAAACGVRGGAVGARTGQAAASSASASRIV